MYYKLRLLLFYPLFFSFLGCQTAQLKDKDNIQEGAVPDVPQNESWAEVPNYRSAYGPIPHTYNAHVERWIGYYTGRGRRHMERYLKRSTRYEKLMKRALREAGMPEDLFYVVYIESGFSFSAHSHASAVGYWQFIRGTGKRYGLTIDGYIDERRDPVLSTAAAAQYFKALYNLFGDWYLALAAYNTGEARVKRAVMKYGTRNFWTLRRRRKLHSETRAYIPKYLAARMIAKNPAQYGFTKINYHDPLAYDTVFIKKPISLKKLGQTLNVDRKVLRRLNARYRTEYVPTYIESQTPVKVPKGTYSQAVAALSTSFSKPLPMVADYFRYRVRRGDTLSTIAQRYRTRVSTLRRMNRISRRSMIRIGQRLRIPERRRRKAVVSNSYTKRSRIQSPGVHKVRKGENLSLIAIRYGTSVSDLRRFNNLGRRSLLRVGQKLIINSRGLKAKNSKRVRHLSSTRYLYHRVKAGESLSEIAEMYNVGLSKVLRLNKLSVRAMIHVNQKIKIKILKKTNS